MTMTTITVKGELTAWTQFGHKGWGKGIVRTADGSEVCVVGVIPGARAGDAIVCQGHLETHDRFGEQLHVSSADLTVPSSVDGAISWIAATLPNLGRKRATDMVAAFDGDLPALWRAIEMFPDSLTSIDGITPERAREIHDAFIARSAERDDHIQLRGWGLTDGQIGKCIQRWRTSTKAVSAIREDPYALYLEIDGIGFLTADRVALRTGLPRDAPSRILAALVYVLEQHAGDGHVYMLPGVFQQQAEQLLGLPRSRVFQGILMAMKRGLICKRGARIYSRITETLESTLAGHIQERLADPCNQQTMTVQQNLTTTTGTSN